MSRAAQRDRLDEYAARELHDRAWGQMSETEQGDAMSAWRWNDGQSRRFGLRSAAALPPMRGDEAQIAKEATRELYWRGILSRDEVNIEIAAIDAANAAYIAGKGKGGFTAKLRDRLIDRDGEDCWLCCEPLGEDRTIEHKIALARGGTWAFDNLALAHRSCNQLLGSAGSAVKEAARRLASMESRT